MYDICIMISKTKVDKNNKAYLTSDHFYQFFQCPHWIWYDLYGDETKKGRYPRILEMIYRDGLKHAQHIASQKEFEDLKPEQYQDLDEAFMSTLEMMRAGKNIYRGVLLDQHWVGMPDLLEARKGKSNLGDHYYVAYDIKNASEMRDDYKFALVFYSLILERIQGVLPEEAYIVNSKGEEFSFKVRDFMDEFHIARDAIEQILDGARPAPFLKSGCKKSPWFSLCVEESQGCNDVSLVYRLSQSDQKRLYDLDIRTVEKFAATPLRDLEVALEDWPYDKLIRLHNQANVLIKNEPLVLKHIHFPKVETEIYFDVESDPTDNIDYLLGILIQEKGEKPVYRPFWAESKDDEKRNWEEFLEFLHSLDSFAIYHYAFYEKEVFKRLSNSYGISRELFDKFMNNTVDIHRSVIDSVILPIYFYSLKDVARFAGFNWRAPDAGGAESVVWYSEWRETGDVNLRKKLLNYNEDDVQATLYVKEWLEKLKPRVAREKLDE